MAPAVGPRNGSRSNLFFLILLCCLNFFALCLNAALPRLPSDFASDLAFAAPPQALSSELNSRDNTDTTVYTTEYYWWAYCLYPVSGIYTRFQRILFYLILGFIFCSRFHKWLALIGIVYFVGLTGIAACHGIGLGLQDNIGLDADNLALTVILQVAGTASLIFALYPPRSFNHNSSPFFILWCGFLSFASICISWTTIKWASRGVVVAVQADCSDPSASACAHACDVVEYTKVLYRTAKDKMVPVRWVELDYSRTSDTVYARSVINNTLTSTWIGPVTNANSISVDHSIQSLDASTPYYTVVRSSPPNYTSSLVSLALWLPLRTTLLTATYPPKVARNWIFRRLAFKEKLVNMTRRQRFLAKAITILWYLWQAIIFIIWPLTILQLIITVLIVRCGWVRQRPLVLHTTKYKPPNKPSKTRVWWARLTAIVWYIWGMSAFVLWPAVLFIQICFLEAATNGIPESESLVSVGQWASWVNVALAFLAAFYAKIRDSRMNENISVKERILLDEMACAAEAGQLDKLPRFLRDPPEWVSRHPQIWSSLVTLVREFQDLKAWWKDPVTAACLADLSDDGGEVKNDTKWRQKCEKAEGADTDPDFGSLWATISAPHDHVRLVDPPRASTESNVPGSRSSDCRRSGWVSYLPCPCESCQGKEVPTVHYYTEQDAREDEVGLIKFAVTLKELLEKQEEEKRSKQRGVKQRVRAAFARIFRGAVVASGEVQDSDSCDDGGEFPETPPATTGSAIG